jgi:cell division septation protein DedD
MFGKKYFFIKLVVLLCLLSLIHGRKCYVKSGKKEIKNIEENNNEIETTIPLKHENDSNTQSENNIETISDAQSIETVTSTVEVSSSTVDVSSSTVDVSSSTVDVSSSTVEVSSSTVDVTSSTVEVSSSTPISTESETSVFTSTTENDEPTLTSSPTPTETIDEYEEEPDEYEIKVKLEITEDIKNTLKDLKKKYPEYFENYKSSAGIICDDQCFLNKLALVKLSNDIKSFIDKNKNLMNKMELYKYEKYNYLLYHNYLPHDEACAYNAAVHPINHDKDYSGYFYIFSYINDEIMERIKNQFEKNVVSIRNIGKIEMEAE